MISAAESPFLSVSGSPAGLGSALAAIGREQPVVFDEAMGAPLILRYRDVAAALRDTATFSTQFYGVGPMSGVMIANDGVEHARQRRIHNRFFSASASTRYAEMVRPIAERTFAPFGALTSAELLGDAISRYPMRVFLSLLGIPEELGDQGMGWVRDIMAWLATPMNAELVTPGMQAHQALGDYIRELVERERVAPSDNLLGEIVKAHIEEGGYSSEAVTVAVVGLLLGGFETTIQMLAGTIVSLLLHPEALSLVRSDPSTADAAFDEAFRWASPTAGLYRLVLRDTEVAGTPISAGGMVYLAIAAAHFDEEAFGDATRFTVGRKGAHLGFGIGPHYCVGAPLARIEARAALSVLLESCPKLRLDPARPLAFRYGARGFVQHGTDALPVLMG